MNICVCGWYGREFDEFYMTLYKANRKHPVMVIAKKEDSYWMEMGLDFKVIENIGLEWAAYDYYLKNIWQNGDVFFTHDDVRLLPIVQDNRTVSPERLFDKLAELQYDQAYIFSNRAEDVYNMGCHGRAMFVSEGLMSWLCRRGIYYDQDNPGYTGGKKPSAKMQHYNAGTERFKDLLKIAKGDGYNVLNKVYAPAYGMAYRGKIINWEDLL